MSDTKNLQETVTNAVDEATSRVRATGDELGALSRKWWLAGLGAIDETRSAGDRVLTRLVERGEGVVEARGDETPMWRRPLERVTEQTEAMRERIESGVDQTVGGFLRRAQVPTRDDLEGLYARVERLTMAIEQLKDRTVAPADAKA